jgi:putative tricarboxylic transport membrane protein
MSRRGELLSAAFWALLGGAVLVASWRMDRLADRGINPLSAPGLTPGVVGALMLVLAALLAWHALRRAEVPSISAGGDAPTDSAHNAGRTLLAGGLCWLFALSLGRGLPFAAEAATFVFLFTSVFSWPTWRAERRIARGLAQTLAIAVGSALAISWLFESVFLVRLP